MNQNERPLWFAALYHIAMMWGKLPAEYTEHLEFLRENGYVEGDRVTEKGLREIDKYVYHRRSRKPRMVWPVVHDASGHDGRDYEAYLTSIQYENQQ